MKVKVFADTFARDVAEEVEEFLNATKGIQILDISWIARKDQILCIITYFEV